jgi:diacylglycerol kinase
MIVIAIAMVWTAEFINTALEAIVDLASPEQHDLAKISKDVGASAVLIAAASSAIIGIIILGPPLWERLMQVFN